jgi:PAS domain S-box-containing protein
VTAERVVGKFPVLDNATLLGAIESAAEQARMALYVAHIDVHPPRIIYVNACASDIVGRPTEELLGQVPWFILRDEDKPLVQAMVERPPGAPPALLDLVVQRPDGRQVPISLAATRVHTELGLLAFGYFRDVSHERETLEALRRSEARFRFLVEAAPDGVVILQRGTIAFMNPKAARLLGVETVEAALGRPIASFLPPADAALAGQRIMAMMRDGTEFPPSEYGVLADPTRVVEIKSIVCEWNGGPGVIAFARDVTERKAIQRRLVESDRLAALGTLAAGVAHEINNPLTYAQLSAQRASRLLEQIELSAEVRASFRGLLDDIQHGISRVASITHSLHAFVSHDEDASGPVDVEAVLSRALKMVDNELRHAARLVRDVVPVPRVIGNAARLEQVFVNVLINALKALPAGSTKPHEIRVALARSGERVTITIADTGNGIPAALRGRIFDPFFTTRDVGHGLGLGLSVSKTIVEKLGGEIEVDSIENVGTTVRLHLRAYPTVEEPSPASPATPEPATPAPVAARMRILVVDDEQIICDVLKRILRDHHDVTTVASGPDAIRILAKDQFDVILCDVMMPGMNADELYRRIESERPDIARKFVFMSGGALGSDLESAFDHLPNGRLAKPFKLDQVLSVIASFYAAASLRK